VEEERGGGGGTEGGGGGGGGAAEEENVGEAAETWKWTGGGKVGVGEARYCCCC